MLFKDWSVDESESSQWELALNRETCVNLKRLHVKQRIIAALELYDVNGVTE